MVDFDLNKIDPKVVSDAALKGDPIALDIYKTAGYYLGLAISNMIMALEPERIIVTGGVAAAGRSSAQRSSSPSSVSRQRKYGAERMLFMIVSS